MPSSINEDQPVTVTSRSVDCDGGGGALGHPRVFLKIDAEGSVTCPYCSRRFILDAGVGTGETPGH